MPRHRHSPFPAVMVVCALTACGGGSRSNTWDAIDYQNIRRSTRAPVDNDAYYSLPRNHGCLDDAPGQGDGC